MYHTLIPVLQDGHDTRCDFPIAQAMPLYQDEHLQRHRRDRRWNRRCRRHDTSPYLLVAEALGLVEGVSWQRGEQTKRPGLRVYSPSLFVCSSCGDTLPACFLSHPQCSLDRGDRQAVWYSCLVYSLVAAWKPTKKGCSWWLHPAWGLTNLASHACPTNRSQSASY